MSIAQKLENIQTHMKKQQIDGWLLYDYEGRNSLATQFMEIPENTMLTRSLFYWVPAQGSPTAIVHAVEEEVIAHLPGEKKIYSGRNALLSLLEKELSNAHTIAMEYSPNGNIPHISMVDAGTVDLIRNLGKKVIGSGNFLQEVICVLSKEQLSSHTFAAGIIRKALDESWGLIRSKGIGISEKEVQQKIISIFEQNGCIFQGGPIVAFGKNAANPHYEVKKEGSSTLEEGDMVLIDLWCKQREKGSIYADVTEMGVYATQPTKRQQEIFSSVLSAQNDAVNLLLDRYKKGEVVKGFELDQVARNSIQEAGYGAYFTHRLGHNIYTTDHGPGANLDSFESTDDRQLIRGTCFSIEPGIYIQGDCGVRLELDVYIPLEGEPQITTGQQQELILLR